MSGFNLTFMRMFNRPACASIFQGMIFASLNRRGLQLQLDSILKVSVSSLLPNQRLAFHYPIFLLLQAMSMRCGQLFYDTTAVGWGTRARLNNGPRSSLESKSVDLSKSKNKNILQVLFTKHQREGYFKSALPISKRRPSIFTQSVKRVRKKKSRPLIPLYNKKEITLIQ